MNEKFEGRFPRNPQSPKWGSLALPRVNTGLREISFFYILYFTFTYLGLSLTINRVFLMPLYYVKLNFLTVRLGIPLLLVRRGSQDHYTHPARVVRVFSIERRDGRVFFLCFGQEGSCWKFFFSFD